MICIFSLNLWQPCFSKVMTGMLPLKGLTIDAHKSGNVIIFTDTPIARVQVTEHERPRGFVHTIVRKIYLIHGNIEQKQFVTTLTFALLKSFCRPILRNCHESSLTLSFDNFFFLFESLVLFPSELNTDRI